MTEPILIQGMGLAGCLLGHALEARKMPFRAMDAAWPGAASPKAAGLMNPLAGRALTPASDWSMFWTQAKASYQRLEQVLDRSFFSERIFYTVFRNPEEAQHWQGLLEDTKRQAFLDQSVQGPEQSRAPHGGIGVKGGGQVHPSILLELSRNRWRRMGLFQEGKVQNDRLIPLGNGRWQYDGRQYAAVVACGGAMDLDNPHWAFLGIRPNAGERLLLDFQDAAQPPFSGNQQTASSKMGASDPWPYAFRKGGLLAPTPGGPWWLGSANRWDSMEHRGSEAGLEQLGTLAESMHLDAFRVVEHAAGIRSTMRDRRPVVGPHPKEAGLWCFNGLGTKGSLWAPWHAEALANALHETVAKNRIDGSAPPHHPLGLNTTVQPNPGPLDPDKPPALMQACLPARFWS